MGLTAPGSNVFDPHFVKRLGSMNSQSKPRNCQLLIISSLAVLVSSTALDLDPHSREPI